MGIHDLDQPAPPRRYRRAVLIGAVALALVLATIGITAALADRSSSTTHGQAPSVSLAVPSSTGAAPAATQQAPSKQVAPNPTTSTPAAPVLADGTYPTYIDKVYVDRAKITIDVIQVFENEAATNAAIEDGMAPDEAQYLYIYVRNQNPRLRTLPVAGDVDIQFADGCEAPHEQHAALTELAERTTPCSCPLDSLYYYDVTVTNGEINQITQRLAEAAC